MKTMKKIFAIMVVMVMAIAMATTVSAVNITIDGGNADGSTYSAYKLLTIQNADTDNFYYEVNEDYRGILKTAMNDDDASDTDIVNYIKALTGEDVQTFADSVYAAIGNTTADYTTTTNVFNVDPGYYLIAETDVTPNSDEVYSLVMLDTARNTDVPVSTKEGTVTVTKTVTETDDSTDPATTSEGIVADYDIGDDVPFTLTGTLPDKYEHYETYEYIFHDTLSAGMKYNDDVQVTIDGTEVKSGYTVVSNGTSLTISFEDLKAAKDEDDEVIASTKNSVVVVTYTAELLDTAVIGGDGNPNSVYLEFSNNPYDEGTGKTEEVEVIVYTFKVTVSKVDGSETPLNGAIFTLYKKVAGEYAVVEEIDGAETSTFEWKGLDAGDYKIVETEAPEGYVKAADIEFTIDPTYNGNELTTLTTGNAKVAATIADGNHAATVVNTVTGTLPSTGGIGTKIFYAVGGVLFVGAMILLITKKRMSTED